MRIEDMIEWGLQEFGEYGVSRLDILDALEEVYKRDSYYKTDQKKMHGIRDYLYEVKGRRDIPMRVGRYRRLGEEI